MLSKDKTDKTEKTDLSVMIDMLIVLVVLAGVAVYYYGLRSAVVTALAVGVCCVVDFICIKLRKKDFIVGDISAVITGLMLGLMMSASVPYSNVIVAAIFAVAVAKHPFGGHGCEIFSPAAAGFLFTEICFPDGMLTYPKPFTEIPLSSIVPESILGQSMTRAFITAESSSVTYMDILIGKFSGPMGTGFILLLIVAAVFLMCRRSVSAIAFFAELLSAGIAAFIHYGFKPLPMLYFYSGGMFIFGALFLSCGCSTVPKTRSSRLIYGIVTGLCMALFHFYAHSENAIVYAVIISAPVGIELDRRALSFAEMLKGRKGIFMRVNKPFSHVAETLDIINDKKD